MVENPPEMQGAAGDAGSIPGSGRSPGGGHGSPFQEIPMDRGAWWATVHRAVKSWTGLKRLSKARIASLPWGCQIWLCLMCMQEKALAPHSSTLAWEIPWTEEPGGLLVGCGPWGR